MPGNRKQKLYCIEKEGRCQGQNQLLTVEDATEQAFVTVCP